MYHCEAGIFRIVLQRVLVALLFFATLPSVSAESIEKQVLVIHSYHEGFSWTDGQNAGIRETFAERPGSELTIEYMDSKRIEYETIAPVFSDYLTKKWGNHSFDAVIVTDNNALEFIASHRSQLFPETPVFFSGINDFTPEMTDPFGGHISGVIQELDPDENIKLIQSLQPHLKRLAIVSGTTPSAQAIVNEVKALLEKGTYPFEPLWLNGLDTASLKDELSKLGPNDAVLLCNFNRDTNGVYYSHEESARFISKASGAPVYAMEDDYLGTGVVGGFMIASIDQGRTVAELCLEALESGALPDIVKESPNEFMFDYAAMSRFQIAEDLLPASAIILNKPVSFYLRHKRLIWNVAILFPFLLIALVGVSFGLLRSRRAEAAVRRNEEKLRVTLLSIGDAVISTDTQRRIVSMNSVAEDLTGWSNEDAKGRDLDEVFRIINESTRQPQKNPVNEALRTGEIVSMSNHTILISKDGTEYQVADSSAPIRDDNNQICGVVMVFRDVTEEYALQEQLQQSQKMDAIGQLAGGVAHDLNNMLGGIMGGAELLRQTQNLSPESDGAEFLGIIEDSTRRAAELTGRLLAFARRQAVASTPVDVHAVLKETVALLRQTIDKRVEVKILLDAESSTIIGDNAQLQSVFMNLGINAAHAMPDGGSLVYSTRVTETSATQSQIEGFFLAPGPYLQITVRDTGCGIPPEHQSHVFEPFFTTKGPDKGTGLGLAAVHGIVKQHDGSISLYSELEKGTVFHILLPLTDEATSALPARAKAVHGKGVILLIDDEAIMRATGEAFLKEYGYQVLVAENGKQAVEIVKENPSKIDLVVLDMIMPEMNGRDCFFHLRKINPALPIILSSGFSRAEDLEDMKKAHLDGFIQKPFRGAEFSGLIAKILQRN